MCKGFGRIERKIITYLEDSPQEISKDIIEAIADHKPPTAADKSKIYRAIKRLKDRDVLLPGKTRNLFYLGGNLPEHQIPKSYRLDKENTDYQQYKRR